MMKVSNQRINIRFVTSTVPSDRHQVFHRPGLTELPHEADPVAHLPLRAAGQLPDRAVLPPRLGHLLQPGKSELESIPF